jgi:hypothetical protein
VNAARSVGSARAGVDPTDHAREPGVAESSCRRRALPPREVSRLGHVQAPARDLDRRPSLAIIAMAAHRLLGRPPPSTARSRVCHRELGIEVRDSLPCCDELRMIAARRARPLPSVDQLLVAPRVDRLLRHSEVGSDVRDFAAGLLQVEHLATELRWVSPRHAGLSSGLISMTSQTTRLHRNPGHIKASDGMMARGDLPVGPDDERSGW